MDVLFPSQHNLHWDSVEQFFLTDPQLRNLKKLSLISEPTLVKQLPSKTPGIYTLGGGRQIGKTTLVKQWMGHLLGLGISPEDIVFFTGEIINDHQSLIQLLQDYLKQETTSQLRFIIIDEITYIQNWDQGIKYLADGGFFENTIVLLTGSDLTFIQEARMRFPGRRGSADRVDFHLYPLSFFEFVHLKYKTIEPPPLNDLFKAFESYLIHGGFLTAINQWNDQQAISQSTLNTYSDWIRGDVLKRGKHETFLKEIFLAILKCYGSQVTWNSLSHHTSIQHPNTLQDYVHLLEAMDVLFVQHALIEDKLLAAPKKAKKVLFKDIFIYHAIRNWVNPSQKPLDQDLIPALVEGCVVSHYQRFYPSFYIKAEGEVDLAYMDQGRFYPLEVKWTHQIRPKDLKQIRKYPNGLVLTKMKQQGVIEQVPTYPLPLHLFELGKKMMGKS